jgi:dTDP-4-amino-4,6-dideoxygalactose transaminase
LVLALRGLGIGSGDEVITASFSFFATAEAISAVGATPVFVDVDPVTYLIDLNLIEAAITPATKVLLPVHLFGRPVDMARITEIAQRRGLKVVEDCAQATGASWDSKPVGSWGDVGCFSFFPTKNLGAAGDGGAMTCQDDELAQRMRELAVHGMPRRYLHTALGYNSRLDSIQAAVLNVKLPYLSGWVKKRAAIAKRYLEALKDLTGLQLPDSAIDAGVGHGWNQFVVRVGLCPSNQPTCGTTCFESASPNGLPSSRCRDWLKQSLQEQGVNTIIYYPIPIHRQPAYEGQAQAKGNLPITDQLCSEVLSLPIFPELKPEQQERVIAVLREQLVAQIQERMVA